MKFLRSPVATGLPPAPAAFLDETEPALPLARSQRVCAHTMSVADFERSGADYTRVALREHVRQLRSRPLRHARLLYVSKRAFPSRAKSIAWCAFPSLT